MENHIINKEETPVDAFGNLGIVSSIADGIISVIGLFNVAYNETITIYTEKEPVLCLVLNIEKKKVSAIVMGGDNRVVPGQYAVSKGTLISVPTGQGLLGRIVDPLGNPIDAGDPIVSKGPRMVEIIAPSIISRAPVNKPLETGLKIVDSLIPIGHGQRELIIGDSKTGKTSIGIDTILNQSGSDTLSIYVAIGQKRASVARIKNTLLASDCLKSTIIVAATASDSAALQYLAPYSGVSMAEYFMYLGLRVVCIYDDLTKHAVSYRQLSLLLRRPPGREGYPGDVFFLHSRLLERAANLLGKGSVTALPIIETIQSDVSAYVPTNVISITDGQIFLETELFARGIRPSASPGLSVSRVGSAAQNPIMKMMAGPLKLLLAQFREVEGFTKLGFVLDDATKQLVETGQRLTELLIQPSNNPVSIDRQILFLFAAMNRFIEWLPASGLKEYEELLNEYYDESPFEYVLSNALVDYVLDKLIVGSLLWLFTARFISYFFDEIKNNFTLV